MSLLSVGTTFGNHVVEAALGAGAFGEVYRVRNQRLDTVQAVKVLFNLDPSARERLLREGRAQARVVHPNIVRVYDILTVHGHPALLMDWVDGPALDLLLLRGRPSVAEIDALAQGLVEGIAAAHAAGLVHRDIKPANILVARGADGRPVARLTDFGLVKVLRDDAPRAVTAMGASLGSERYRSPEQTRDPRTVDARSDVFSLGVVLYELVTGRAFGPAGADRFDLDTFICTGPVPGPEDFPPGTPASWVDAICGALERDAGRRVRSARELGVIWRGGVARPAAAAAGPSVGAAAARPATAAAGGRWPLVLALVGIGVVGVGALGWRWRALSRGPAGGLSAAEGSAVPVAAVAAAPAPAPVVPPVPAEAVVPAAPAAVAAPTAPAGEVPGAGAAVAPGGSSAPDAAPAPRGRVVVLGDAPRVWLVDGARRLAPGAVPPGRYAVQVLFDGVTPMTVLDLEVRAGRTVRLTCSAALLACQVMP